MIWALMAQLILIALGYCVALAAAGGFASIVFANVVSGLAQDPEGLIDFAVLAMAAAFEAMQHSFVPTALAVLLAESLRLRSLAVYLALGCAVGLMTALPLDAVTTAPAETISAHGPALRFGVASAAVGAFFYWLIAGRTAGRWLEIGGFAPTRG